MSVRAEFFAQASMGPDEPSTLLWRTDASPEETLAQLTEAIGSRDGSWTDGTCFQLAPSCDPWAPVLDGQVHAGEQGTEIRAELSVRQEVRDLLRLGRFMLFVIITAFAAGALVQLRGMELWLSLLGLALGAAFAAGSQAMLQTCMLESAKKSVDQKQLCQLLTRMLRS